jgi:hypothetical protein
MLKGMLACKQCCKKCRKITACKQGTDRRLVVAHKWTFNIILLESLKSSGDPGYQFAGILHHAGDKPGKRKA